VERTYDDIAREFHRTRSRPWDEVVRFIGSGPIGKVLDIGCGNGRHMEVALENGTDAVGLDLSSNLLDICSERFAGNGQVDLVKGDAISLPFGNGVFDRVLCIAVLHHVPSRRKRQHVLGEMFRCLKNGGVAQISVWNFDQDRFRTLFNKHSRDDFPGVFGDVTIPWHKSDGRVVDRFYHLYTKEELEDELIRSPFSIDTVKIDRGNIFAQLGKD